MVPLISFLLALVALVVAVVNGAGKNARIPLWVAVACLAVALMLPHLVLMLL
ncbi:MAG: hypothetical protein ACRD9L_11940 [Bryobacteraceae bacterium]